jgi:hypothetical protein
MTIQLEQEQEDLLSILVEACRNLPREQREPFIARTFDDSVSVELLHRGLPNGRADAYPGDIDTLAREGLISLANELHGLVYSFDIVPQGFAHYRPMKQRDIEPLQRIEARLRSHLESDRFQRRYGKAYEKWKDAETLLWDSDSARQLTTFGHLCREAIQEFATSLVEYYQPVEVDSNKARDIVRVSAVIKSQAAKLGDREEGFLDALISYWRTVSGLVQRQEHGTQNTSRALVWEDGRRVVFQTAIVMFEVDNSLSKAH